MDMEQRKLEVNGFYKHFKGKLYQVRGVAYHSETKEKMVVYQALYGDYSLYVRPYDMFMSEVDHVKYPNVSQKYRFEQVHPDGFDMPHNRKEENAQNTEKVQNTEKAQNAEKMQITEKMQNAENMQNTPEEAVDERLLQFLDAETYKDKLNTLTALRAGLDDKIIDAMAASIDVEVPPDEIEKRYMSLRSCIMTRMKYERSRADR